MSEFKRKKMEIHFVNGNRCCAELPCSTYELGRPLYQDLVTILLNRFRI